MRLLKAATAAIAVALAAIPAAREAAAQPATQPTTQLGADTIGTIRQRGQLLCGTASGVVGFSAPDSQGVMRGIDADTCRAVAAAIFGSAEKVRFVPTTTQNRFTALQSGEVDMLVRSTTWTLGREAALGLEFAGVNFYDGTGFMVKTSSGITSAKNLDGATICTQPGSTTELSVTDYFRANNMKFTPVVIENVEELRSAFINGRCDAYTTDASSLAGFRYSQGPNASQYTVLPEIISKEPLGSMVRKGDWRFFDIVRWTHFAQLTAEELGINSGNVDSFANSDNPEIQRFTGKTGELGKMLGLDPAWAVNVVKQVGNYGEVWDRNITPMGVPRGLNNLWNKGGLQFAPPMR